MSSARADGLSDRTSHGSKSKGLLSLSFKKAMERRFSKQKSVKFNSVSPGIEEANFSKDSNWDPNSISEEWRFPWIYDPIVYQEYMDHQRDCLNVKSTLFLHYCCFPLFWREFSPCVDGISASLIVSARINCTAMIAISYPIPHLHPQA
jgi:hypothetical protein